MLIMWITVERGRGASSTAMREDDGEQKGDLG